MVAVGGRDAGIIRRRTRSDALPENTVLQDLGHPHAPAEDGGTAGLGRIGPFRRTRSDALPENTRYTDTGCDVHPSCLTCPLVRCRYDEPGGARRVFSEGRDRSIVALRRSGRDVEEIASRFGVSRRTVFRALARSRNGRRRSDGDSGE
jgi:transposase-like protein